MQSAPLELNFQLTDIEYKPLANQPARLILGEGQDLQAADTGNRFVTDAEGRAQYTTSVITEKRWQWVNIGFTPFSVPTRTDHLQIAIELNQLIPTPDGGEDRHLPFLYRMDVDLRNDGTCSTLGITSMYVQDGRGRFRQRVPTNGLPTPNSGGLVLFGEGYQPWDYMLELAEPPKRGWRLKLAFKQLPRPVRR